MSLGSFWARINNLTTKEFSPKSISINGHQFGFLSSIEITQTFENDTGVAYVLPTYEKVFTESVCANDGNKDKAKKEISEMHSNLISTEMEQLFEELFERSPLKKRDIFIITDGVVNKQEEVVRLIRINKESNRIFALGIGDGNDSGFLDEIAEITNGRSIFVYKTEDLQKKASELLDLSLTPVFNNNE